MISNHQIDLARRTGESMQVPTGDRRLSHEVHRRSCRSTRPEGIGSCDEIGYDIDVDRRATGYLASAVEVKRDHLSTNQRPLHRVQVTAEFSDDRPELPLRCVRLQQAGTIISHG